LQACSFSQCRITSGNCKPCGSEYKARGHRSTTTAQPAEGERETPAWALIANLRMDPYEKGLEEGGGAIDFLARSIWLLVPIQGKIKEFFTDFDKYPFQRGSTLNANGINYGWPQQQAALKRLGDLERLMPQ
jgi:hypothetical protein